MLASSGNSSSGVRVSLSNYTVFISSFLVFICHEYSYNVLVARHPHNSFSQHVFHGSLFGLTNLGASWTAQRRDK
jgi:hypothetical protein